MDRLNTSAAELADLAAEAALDWDCQRRGASLAGSPSRRLRDFLAAAATALRSPSPALTPTLMVLLADTVNRFGADGNVRQNVDLALRLEAVVARMDAASPENLAEFSLWCCGLSQEASYHRDPPRRLAA